MEVWSWREIEDHVTWIVILDVEDTFRSQSHTTDKGEKQQKVRMK